MAAGEAAADEASSSVLLEEYITRLRKQPVSLDEYNGKGRASSPHFQPIGLTSALMEFDKHQLATKQQTSPRVVPRPPKQHRRRKVRLVCAARVHCSHDSLPQVSEKEQRLRLVEGRGAHRQFKEALAESRSNAKACELVCCINYCRY